MNPKRGTAVLVVQVGGDLYAIPCRDVVTVLPLPTLRRLPGAPAALLGTFSYGASVVPVVDLSHALTGEATAERLAVRVVVSSTRDGLVGVLVGRVADVRSVPDADRRLDVSRHAVVAEAVVLDGRPVHMLTLGSALPAEYRGLMASA